MACIPALDWLSCTCGNISLKHHERASHSLPRSRDDARCYRCHDKPLLLACKASCTEWSWDSSASRSSLVASKPSMAQNATDPATNLFSSPIQASNTQPATGPLPSCAHLYTFDSLQPQIYPELDGSVVCRSQARNTVKSFNRNTMNTYRTYRTCVGLSCATLTTTRLSSQLKPLFRTPSVAFSWAVRSCVAASVALASESCRASAASGCHDLNLQRVQPEFQARVQSHCR